MHPCVHVQNVNSPPMNKTQPLWILLNSSSGSLLLLGGERLHLHLHGLLSDRLCGGSDGARRPCAAGSGSRCGSRLRSNPGVEGSDQPVERRVVDQVIHDVVERLFHFAQLDLAAAQHAVRHVSQHLGLAEAGVDVGGGAGEGKRLLLDVAGEALQAGDEDQAGGLELLGEGVCQGQSARLDHLRGRGGGGGQI